MDKKEVWKDVENYEGLYCVSNMGRIKSLSRKRLINKTKMSYHLMPERVLVIKKDKNGYCHVTLCKENIKKTFWLHRIVLKHFIENINNLPQINHKNGNKSDNRVENLEWCTSKYNYCESVRLGLRKNGPRKPYKNSKKIAQIKDGKIVKIFENRASAVREFGGKTINVGSSKRCYGYHWQYFKN
jgi:hypothetical protein